jgi:ribonuclease HI
MNGLPEERPDEDPPPLPARPDENPPRDDPPLTCPKLLLPKLRPPELLPPPKPPPLPIIVSLHNQPFFSAIQYTIARSACKQVFPGRFDISRMLLHNKNMKFVNIYTDGACSGNQHKTNIGGFGAILEYNGHEKELFGGEVNTTNNRMEMTALLAALRALKKADLPIRVFADSAYLLNCFRNKWYGKWKQNNWKTSKNEPVENRDLWEKLLKFLDIHRISFFKVKGHVNPHGDDSALRAAYGKFLEWNGPGFDRDEFLHATIMNNRADALANRGIAQIRAETRAAIGSDDPSENEEGC